MKTSFINFTLAAVFLFTAGVCLYSESSDMKQQFPDFPPPVKWNPIFPSFLFIENLPECSARDIVTVKTKEETEIENGFDESKLQSVLLNNDIFALYGKPNAYTMGILGRYELEDIEPVLNEFVKMYDSANKERGIIPALYIIYGTCWPEGEIGLLPSSLTKKYIEFAAKKGWYVFIDHQIGRYSVENAIKAILPFLKYPNVHLALDPEWHTSKPMKVIGSVTADEINNAQKIMNNYIKENNIAGRRMLVIHQFNATMIKQRANVKTDFDMVQLIHCADGFGSPRLKKESYAYNALAKNIPLKSFKLFLKPTIAGAGFDSPLMTPEEVFDLKPRPYLIMYQ